MHTNKSSFCPQRCLRNCPESIRRAIMVPVCQAVSCLCNLHGYGTPAQQQTCTGSSPPTRLANTEPTDEAGAQSDSTRRNWPCYLVFVWCSPAVWSHQARSMCCQSWGPGGQASSSQCLWRQRSAAGDCNMDNSPWAANQEGGASLSDRLSQGYLLPATSPVIECTVQSYQAGFNIAKVASLAQLSRSTGL